MLFKSSVIIAFLALASAHPGHEAEEHRQAIAARATNLSNKRALANCADSLASRGIYTRGIERRKAELAKQRMAKRIPVAGELTSGESESNTAPVLIYLTQAPTTSAMSSRETPPASSTPTTGKISMPRWR